MGSTCSRCDKDIASEQFHYETDNGALLCEECFSNTRDQMGEAAGGQFVFLSIGVRIIKGVSFVALGAGLIIAHSFYPYNALLAGMSLIAGVFIFFFCLMIAESVRLGIMLHRRLDEVGRVTDRVAQALEKRSPEYSRGESE